MSENRSENEAEQAADDHASRHERRRLEEARLAAREAQRDDGCEPDERAPDVAAQLPEGHRTIRCNAHRRRGRLRAQHELRPDRDAEDEDRDPADDSYDRV